MLSRSTPFDLISWKRPLDTSMRAVFKCRTICLTIQLLPFVVTLAHGRQKFGVKTHLDLILCPVGHVLAHEESILGAEHVSGRSMRAVHALTRLYFHGNLRDNHGTLTSRATNS